MNKWNKFSVTHPSDTGFYLVSVKCTFWDSSTVVRSISIKPFDPIRHTFWGFKNDPEWRYEVEAWMDLPPIYIKDL